MVTINQKHKEVYYINENSCKYICIYVDVFQNYGGLDEPDN